MIPRHAERLNPFAPKHFIFRKFHSDSLHTIFGKRPNDLQHGAYSFKAVSSLEKKVEVNIENGFQEPYLIYPIKAKIWQ